MKDKEMKMKKVFIIIISIILSISTLYAGDTRYNENMHTPQDVTGGTTISPQTGTLSLPFTDVALPGMNGLNFEVTRTY